MTLEHMRWNALAMFQEKGRCASNASARYIITEMDLTESAISIGVQFGSWTVMDEGTLKGRNRYYLCRCACETERLVKYEDMAKLPGRSYACIREQRKKAVAELARARIAVSEIGKSFGAWTALALDEIPRPSRQEKLGS